MLSDREIRASLANGEIIIKNKDPESDQRLPFDETLIQPASVDVLLSNRFRTFSNSRFAMIKATNPPPDLTTLVVIPQGQDFILHPGEFVLASTIEEITLPNHIAARLEGKSSMGPYRPHDPQHRRLHRPRLDRGHHPGALQCRPHPHCANPTNENRPTFVHPALVAVRTPIWLARAWLEVSGPVWPHSFTHQSRLKRHPQ